MATNPKNFSPHRRIEIDYARSINKLLHLVPFKGKTPEEVLRAFANFSKSPEVLKELSTQLARRMVTQLRASNARSWRAAAREASRGREIYEALQKELQTGVGTRVRELVAENAQLISSIPAKVQQEVNNEIAEMEQEGLRPEAIMRVLQKRIPELTRNRARLIARTETGKAATALTQARSEDLGINWYQWLSAEDQRVRPSHRMMDKVLVSWSDPPSPEKLFHQNSTLGHYPAGGAPNCRCVSLPIITLDTIAWPARVYANGSIRRMTRAQFAEISGMQRRIAA